MTILLNILSMILVIIIIAAVIYSLLYLKKIKQKKDTKKNSLDNFHERFNSINKRSPGENDLEELNKLARDLFKEKDNVDYKKSYVEITKDYKTSEETTKSNFCDKMSKIMYSEKSAKRTEITEVMDMFEKILDKNK